MSSSKRSSLSSNDHSAVKPAFIAAAVFLVQGCSSDSPVPQEDQQVLDVTLVVPTDGTSLSRAGSFARITSRNDEICPNVPSGYHPLAGAQVLFLDSDDNLLQGPSVSTDSCGFLSTNLPQGTTSIKAESAGNRDLIASVTTIRSSDGVASTIPANASYRVGFLTQYDANTLGFTITDDVTNKAVVGLGADAFTVVVNGGSEKLFDLQTGLSGEQASVVLVTDASGSMSDPAFDDPVTGISYSRNNLAAIAAHQFLDQKATNDEAAMLIFDRETDFMNDSRLAELVLFEDEAGAAATYTFSESGFTQDVADLRFIVDLYNEDSQVWTSTSQFERHPDSPSLQASSRYPWGGATAFYPATVLASEKLDERPNTRRLIVALSDGENNRGVYRLNEVIDIANTNGTPVYTIGFEFSEDFELTRLASETGATYYQADSLEVSDAYASIQTNIIYQYTGTLPVDLVEGSVVSLVFDIEKDGIPEAEREL